MPATYTVTLPPTAQAFVLPADHRAGEGEMFLAMVEIEEALQNARVARRLWSHCPDLVAFFDDYERLLLQMFG